MPIRLPTPIADYFAADSDDASAIARCFHEDAIVVDERATYKGRAAIAGWKAETARKYSYLSEPIAVTAEADVVIVTAHVSGNFPGSPIDLNYGFILEDGAIARLEIVLPDDD